MKIDRKLSDDDVRAIRQAAHEGASDKAQAEKYGVHPAFVAAIRLGRCRKRAGGPITRRARVATADLERRVARLERRVSRLSAALEAVGAQGVA